MNISAFDLNLLVAFEALLTERSVTRAARRLGLSQPSVSRALSRLRERVGDPLFERTRHGVTPTPRSLAMAEPVRAALEHFKEALSPPAGPTLERTVRVAANAYARCVLLPQIVRSIETTMPQLVLDVHSPSGTLPKELALSIDWAGVAPKPSATHSAVVVRDRLAGIARRGNRTIGARVTLDSFLRAKHVLVQPRRAGLATDVIDSKVSELNKLRRTRMTVPDFFDALWLVSRSDLVAVVPRRLAELEAARLELRVFKPPVSLPDAVLEVAWPREGGEDRDAMWLKARILEAGRELASSSRA